MKAIIKRELRNYLKQPLFWAGIILMIFGVFQLLKPYLNIHYAESEDELKELTQDYPEYFYDADISDGYIPEREEMRRKAWEEIISRSMREDLQMKQDQVRAAIDEIEGMDIAEACDYLEQKYHYYGAISAYRETAFRKGTKDEINSYMEEKLENKSFSYYFSRKFADFTGLFLAFFATVMLSVLFLQDTKKNTYELLHTKPIRPWQYVGGKIAGGYLTCLAVLAVMNVVFWMACQIYAGSRGFEVRLTDFLIATCLYILPNVLMIICVYALVSLLFKSPVPAVPLLILYMVYSNMGSRNAEGVFGYYGRPLAMRVLTTILLPSGGSVTMDGMPYNENNYGKIQSKIGYLPQEIDLYPGLTVQECLEYMGELSGVPRKLCKERIEYYLEKTSLTEQRKKKMKQLSGGMKRRVGLIQALLNDPEFLIVDEPTTGLDPEERIRIRNLLVDFSENRTVLFSTHVVEDLAATCNRLAVMKKGKFLYSGTTEGFMEMAEGHVWLCHVFHEDEARELERKYHISSKQYAKDGMRLKILSEYHPSGNCIPCEGSLEDAYIYITS